MADEPLIKEEIVVDEIFFNCPKCGKSLSIDVRGEGYVVSCPDCHTEVQVPTAGVAAQVTSSTLGELRERLEAIARLRAMDKERFAKIAGEMALVQAALDRVVSLVQDALTPETMPAAHIAPVDEPDE
jgi:hypothetical protein